MNNNEKPEIEKNKGPPKDKEKEKEKNKETKDVTELKEYKVPDIMNKKNFNKINIYNIRGVLKFLYFPELIEISFINQKFYNLINSKFPKRIPLIKKSFQILKKEINFNFSEDFRFILRKNSSFISSITKKMVESSSFDYFPKMHVKKFFFNKMKSNPEIKKLYLANSEIGKKSMKYLSYYFNNKNCGVTDVDLSGNKLTLDILKPLKKINNTKLEKLAIDKSILDAKAFSHLSELKIKKLSLINNNIDDELISKLVNDNINEINLSHNYISNEGIFSICKNLPNLMKLNLANNNICDLSLLYISLYIKGKNNKLESINLKDNKITITGMITFLSNLEKINNTNNKNLCLLKKLNLSGNLLDFVPIPKRLAYFLNIHIEKFCIGNHSFNISDLNILLNFINNLKNISILDLSRIALDNHSLNLIFNRVSENATLQKLKLKNCYLGNTELNNTLKSRFKKDKSKKNNNIYKNKNKNDFNDTIKENEEYNNFNNAEKSEIINNKEEDNKKINENNIEKEENNNITLENKINMEENENNIVIKDEMKNINEIKNNNINENIGVESLDLGYNFINYEKLEKIILSNHLKELNIEGNDLYLWGNDIVLFFDYIVNNKFLEKLNLNKNHLKNMANILLEKINAFNNNNEIKCSLKYLSLEDNQIKDVNLALTNLLSNNKNLEYLNLRNNLIGDDIANNYFFHSIFKSKYSNIKKINISNNKITLNFIKKIIIYSKENEIEKKDFILNITSKEIRESYLQSDNKLEFKELVKLKSIKCL